MTSNRAPALLAASALSAAMLLLPASGCQTPKKEQPAMPAVASADKVAELKAAVEREHPGSQVGQVVAVLPNFSLVSVSGMTTDAMKEGQVISFVDAAGKTIANGTISRFAEVEGQREVHVKYEKSSRDPMRGDAAVWFKE